MMRPVTQWPILKPLLRYWPNLSISPIELFGLAIALVLYTAILLTPIPPSWGYALRYRDLGIMIPSTALFYLAFRGQHRWSWLIGISAVFLLWGMALSALWSSGTSNRMLMGGLIPLSDAPRYLAIARGILEGTGVELSYLRPFAPMFLAVVLGVTQNNLQTTIAIHVAIVALACFILAWEIRRTHGALFAAVVTTGLFIYYRPYLGTVMTENLGIALGSLGLALLWRCATGPSFITVILGFLILTFGMLTRMGALVIVPVLLLWSAQLLATQSRRFLWPFLVIGSGILITGFSLNSWVSRYISNGNYISFGNYAYTLYGLLRGKTWAAAVHEQKEIFENPNLSIEERVSQVYQVCFDIIRNDPFTLLNGIGRAVGSLLTRGTELLFIDHFIPGVSSPALLWTIHWIFWPLLLVGIVGSLRFWKVPLNSLILLLALGTVISAPLVPVWDAGLRPYATTVVAGYLVLAQGIWFSSQGLRWAWRRWLPNQTNAHEPSTSQVIRPLPESSAGQTLAIGLGISLIVFSTAIPLTMRAIIPTASYENISGTTCQAEEEKKTIYYNPSQIVQLVSDQDLNISRVPHLRISDFQKGLETFIKAGRKRLSEELKLLPPGMSILATLTLNDAVVIPTAKLVSQRSGPFMICGQRFSYLTPQKKTEQKQIFQVNAMFPMEKVTRP